MPEIAIAPPYLLTQTRHGPMLVNRNDLFMGQSFLRYGECCEREVQVLLQLVSHPQALPGMVVEVGSNMGVHTVPLARELARLGRRMLAIEPQPVVFQQLCANLALNGLMNVIALPCACAAESGTLSFSPPDYVSPGNFGGTAMLDTPLDTREVREDAAAALQTVPCHRLDDLVPEEPVGLVKIDVEGFELRVLEGARRILERFHPILYVENDRVENSEALIRFLFPHGYRLWWHITSAFQPHNFLQNPHNIYGDVTLMNMLCLHPVHRRTIEGLPEICDPTLHPLKPEAADAQQTPESVHTPYAARC